MYFCDKCDNMYYINIDETKNNIYYLCKKCGNVNNNILTSNNVIYEENINITNTYKISNAINKYTKYDPTLPKISNINCPNAKCLSNTSDTQPNILYIKYDDDNIKFVYLCTHCDYTWNNQ